MSISLFDLRDKIEEVERKLNKLKTKSLDYASMEGEFRRMEKYLNGEVFDLIDLISEEIEKTRDIDCLKNLHFYYGKFYRITMFYLNYKIHKLSNCLNSQADSEEEIDLQEKAAVRDYRRVHLSSKNKGFENGIRPCRPFSQFSVVPVSIARCDLTKIPESWDPPGWEPK